MASDHEAMKQLTQELIGGYNLNSKLLALLSHPLDSHGQKEAMTISQEISRVFMVSLFMLKPDETRVEEVMRTALEARTDHDSNALRTWTKDKLISGEVVTPVRKGREEQVTWKEITLSPDKDGYQWTKYGQKTIQNRNFARYYYRCRFHRDRRCKAKKQVQQQDNSSDPPIYEVNYVDEHTCRQVLPDDDLPASLTPTSTTTPTSNGGTLRLLSGSAEENKEMVACLTAVIKGAAPSQFSPWQAPPAEASTSDLAAYAPAGGHSPSLDDGGMGTTISEMDFPYSPSFALVEATGWINHCDMDMHMDGPQLSSDIEFRVQTGWF